MSEVTENRQCPLCEEIVPSDQDTIPVMVLGRKRHFHPTCVEIIIAAKETHELVMAVNNSVKKGNKIDSK